MEKNIAVWLGVITFITLLLAGLVSAIDVTYTQSNIDLPVDYPKITISEDSSWFGLVAGDKISDVELVDNTDVCATNCHADLKVKIYQTTSNLIEDVNFRKYTGNLLQYTSVEHKQKILIEKEFTKTEKYTEPYCAENLPIKTKEYTCTSDGCTSKDVDAGTICRYVALEKTRQVKYMNYTEYNGEQLLPGEYNFRIEGQKDVEESVDFVPVILGTKIEALAWWNSTTKFGDGHDGSFYFTTISNSFSNMTLGIDYDIAGSTIYLRLDRVYQFSNFYLGPGTTLSTLNTTGAVLYLMVKDNMTVEGNIDLSNRLVAGNANNVTFSYLGDSIATPGTGEGGDNSGYPPAYGFGAGGFTLYVTDASGLGGACDLPTKANINGGGLPFGPGGTAGSASVVRTSGSIGTVYASCGVGIDGNNSKGGGGSGTAKLRLNSGSFSGCTVTVNANGGSAGSNYGLAGGDSGGFYGKTGSCTGAWTYSRFSSGGGGSGGTAGKSGINLWIKSNAINITDSSSIYLQGTAGGNGGNGGKGYIITPNYGSQPGAGGGGGNAGSLNIFYGILLSYNSSNVNVSGGKEGVQGLWFDSSSYVDNGVGSGATPGTSGTVNVQRAGGIYITLNSPTNGSTVVTPSLLNFNVTLDSYQVTSTNATFYLWNSTGLVKTQTIGGWGASVINVLFNATSAELPDENYKWNVLACSSPAIWNGGLCGWANENYTFSTFSVQFGTPAYNNVTYEMMNETYTMNASSTGFVNLSATLVWDNVEYNATITGSLTNPTFSSTIWIPVGSGEKSYHWHVLYGGTLKESSSYNVTVNPSLFSICNSTNNVTYFNITYRDEISLAFIKASVQTSTWLYNITFSPYQKTYTYSNLTEYFSHAYCFDPASQSIVIPTASYRITSAGYAPKTWPFRNLPLTNSSANQILYLISLTDSGTSPVTFQVINTQTSGAQDNARVRVSRDISGVPTVLNDGWTDAAGTISYFMSPITPYTIEVSKPGCTTGLFTITPTNSLYTLAISCSNTNNLSSQVSQLEGVIFSRGPSVGTINPGNYTFFFWVNSSTFNMTRVRFELYDNSGLIEFNDSLTNTADCNSGQCYLTLPYTLYAGDDIKGRYYIATDSNSSNLLLLEADARWITIYINKNNSMSSVSRFFANFNEMIDQWGSVECIQHKSQSLCVADTSCKWVNGTQASLSNNLDSSGRPQPYCLAKDEFNKREFDRFVIIFFFMAVAMFLVGKITGYDFVHVGILTFVFWVLILIGSAYGLFYMNGLTVYPFLNQYMVFMSTTCVAFAFIMNFLRRSQY